VPHCFCLSAGKRLPTRVVRLRDRHLEPAYWLGGLGRSSERGMHGGHSAYYGFGDSYGQDKTARTRAKRGSADKALWRRAEDRRRVASVVDRPDGSADSRTSIGEADGRPARGHAAAARSATVERGVRVASGATRAFAPGYEVGGGSSGDAHSPKTISAALIALNNLTRRLWNRGTPPFASDSCDLLTLKDGCGLPRD
jgi:hypothetical protein